MKRLIYVALENTMQDIVARMECVSQFSVADCDVIVSVVPQDEMSIIIMGSCVAGALLVLLFAIVIALICYCQQSPKGQSKSIAEPRLIGYIILTYSLSHTEMNEVKASCDFDSIEF